MLRVRRRLTQVALASRAGVSRRAVSSLERGLATTLRAGVIESIVATLGGRVDLRIIWNGPELDRLLDASHSALGATVKRRLERWGWVVKVEVSYSEWGERGRVDLLAFSPATGTLLVVELKTMLVDIQALLGTLDTKARLGPTVARRLGWEVRSVVPAVVFLEDQGTRGRLRATATLFDRFSLRGRSAITWLRRPSAPPPSGLLWFASAPVPKGAKVGQRVYPRRSP